MPLESPIIYGNFFAGISGLGKLEQGKFYDIQNADIHTETGLIMPQFAMESESATPNEPCWNTIDPDGNIYFASKTSGKIWKRTTAGSYSLAHTNTNGAHTGCRYFNGYIWYWTSTKLGYFVAGTEASPNNSLATGTAFRGAEEHANSLLIANGRYIARVDANNSVALQEFVMPAQYKATCLKSVGDDVLIGTYVSTSVSYCKVFLWDTVSTSWTYEDEVFEVGINCFIQLDNIIAAQCGTSGRFYYWTGSQMSYFGKIKGITTTLGEQMALTYNGRPLFANGTKIYSIHKEDKDLPYAFCGEYTCTGTIASLAVQGQTLLASVGTGVDKRGTNYATATIETPEAQARISDIKVKYDEYPEGVGISTKVNGATSYTDQTEAINTTEKEVYFNGGTVDGVTMQVKLTLTPDNISEIKQRPKIKSIILR